MFFLRGSHVLGECLEQTQRQPDCLAHLLRLLLQGCGVQGSIIMVFLILWINYVPIEKSSNEGHDGRQRQVKMFTVISCFIKIKLQNWHSCVEMAEGWTVGGFNACKYVIISTISLNKALFHVLLTCICIYLLCLLLFILLLICFLLLSVNKI